MQNDGKTGHARNGLEMSQDACLHRLVVVGHDGQYRVGAGCLGHGRQFQRLAGRVRTGPGDDGYPIACDTDGRGNDFFVLVAAECRILAHGFPDDDRRRARSDLALAQRFKRGPVDPVVIVERCRKVGDKAAKPMHGVMEGHGASRQP